MTAISTRLPEVTIEYDTSKGRATKHFEDANEAKRQFTALDQAGKNPKVLGVAPTPPADDTPASADKPIKPKLKPAAEPAAARMTEQKRTDGSAECKAAKVNATSRAVTRIAGEVIAKYGLDAGITQKMVDEVAVLAGRSNPRQDWFNLRNAWHAINGYLANKK